MHSILQTSAVAALLVMNKPALELSNETLLTIVNSQSGQH